jgi:hypothetical protein
MAVFRPSSVSLPLLLSLCFLSWGEWRATPLPWLLLLLPPLPPHSPLFPPHLSILPLLHTFLLLWWPKWHAVGSCSHAISTFDVCAHRLLAIPLLWLLLEYLLLQFRCFPVSRTDVTKLSL